MSHPALAALPRATFAQLRTFEAVARLGSVTRAAHELHLAQPTVSTQLRELGAGLGVPLFEAAGRGIRLTDTGATLQAAVGDIFRRWALFQDALDERRQQVRGRLRLSGVTTSEYFVARLLQGFLAHHGDVAVDLAVENRAQVVARLDRGDDDCAIMMMPPDSSQLARLPFLANPLVPIVAGSHPWAARAPASRPIDLRRFLREPLLVREPGSGTRRALEAHLAQRRIDVEPRMTLGSNEAVKHAVAAGLGVAVVSRHALAAEPAAEGVAIARVATLPILRTWQLVWRQDRPLTLAARAFLSYVRRGDAAAVP